MHHRESWLSCSCLLEVLGGVDHIFWTVLWVLFARRWKMNLSTTYWRWYHPIVAIDASPDSPSQGRSVYLSSVAAGVGWIVPIFLIGRIRPLGANPVGENLGITSLCIVPTCGVRGIKNLFFALLLGFQTGRWIIAENFNSLTDRSLFTTRRTTSVGWYHLISTISKKPLYTIVSN